MQMINAIPLPLLDYATQLKALVAQPQSSNRDALIVFILESVKRYYHGNGFSAIKFANIAIHSDIITTFDDMDIIYLPGEGSEDN